MVTASISLALPAAAASSDVVVVSDPGLRSCLDRDLGSAGRDITQGDFEQMLTLRCSNAEVVDISPLRFAKSLYDLDLSYNNITTLEPLDGLPNLSGLWATSNEIQDIDLSLPNLFQAYLDENPVFDLRDFDAPGLKSLSVNDTRLGTLSNLPDSGQLIILAVSNADLGSFEGVERFTHLAQITARFNHISDLTSLAELPGLVTANVSEQLFPTQTAPAYHPFTLPMLSTLNGEQLAWTQLYAPAPAMEPTLATEVQYSSAGPALWLFRFDDGTRNLIWSGELNHEVESATFIPEVPVISGLDDGGARVGHVVSISQPEWNIPGADYDVSWRVDGVSEILGSGLSFEVPPGFVGKNLRAQVAASSSQAPTETVQSEPALIVAGILELTPTPTIEGTARVGSQLTAVPGEWDSGTEFSYQWMRGDSPVGADSSTYTVVEDDANSTISVQVTGVKAGYTSVSNTSTQTLPVPALDMIPEFAARIDGVVRVGSTVRGIATGWPSGTSFTYRWLRSGLPVGAGETYSVRAADLALPLTVTVTATKKNYATVVRTSEAVVVEAGRFDAVSLPTVSGLLFVGNSLVAAPGVWPAETVFAYRWMRNGVVIAGESKSKYTLSAADRGKALTVEVTGTHAGYISIAKRSASSAPIGYGSLTGAIPKVTGTAKVGKSLKVTPGTWTAATTTTYQWYRGTTKIAKATKATYKLVKADKRKKISVRVTGTLVGYTTLVKKSTSTAAVK